MNYGIDALGLAKYPKIIQDFLPKGWGVGVFSYVDGFGDGLKALDGLLARRADIPFVRVHLMWRDDHNFTSRDNAFIQKEAKRLLPIIQKYPNVKFFVSPTCEHRLNGQSWNSFASIVSRELASVAFTLVNSPEKPMRVAGVVNEFHSKPGGDAFSADGVSSLDLDTESLKSNYANSAYFMLWNSQCNGRMKADDDTPRAKRKAYPTKEHIQSLIALTGVKGKTGITSGWIYKASSDQHTVPPTGKDCKPVIITPLKGAPNSLALSLNGKILAKSEPRMEFNKEDKNGRKGEQIGWRFYFTKWGFQIAQQPVDLLADGKKVGVVNPSHRDGSFR